jgi:hypothetical protein
VTSLVEKTFFKSVPEGYLNRLPIRFSKFFALVHNTFVSGIEFYPDFLPLILEDAGGGVEKSSENSTSIPLGGSKRWKYNLLY